MSRKWERMIEKNRKTVNKQRVKQGKGNIVQTGTETMQVFKGRSWLMPLFLIGFALFFMIAFSGIYQGDNAYWITVALYFFLGLFIFFVRRPVLLVGKTRLSTRRFGGDKQVKAEDIEAITVSKGAVVVQMKAKRTRWIFSRMMQLYPMEALTAAVREYAKNNQVPIKDEG